MKHTASFRPTATRSDLINPYYLLLTMPKSLVQQTHCRRLPVLPYLGSAFPLAASFIFSFCPSVQPPPSQPQPSPPPKLVCVSSDHVFLGLG